MPNERQLSLLPALLVWAVLCLLAALYGTSMGFGGRPFAVTLGVFLFLFGVEFLLACGNSQQRLAALGPGAGFLLSVGVLGAYFVYALSTGTFTWWHATIAAAFVLVPLTLAFSSERGAAAPRWQDFAVILALFLPFKFGVLTPLWAYPEGRLGSVLSILMALNVGIAAFLFVRKLDGVGYSIAWAKNWGFIAGLSFVVFGAIAIPLGRALGFIHFGPHWAQWKSLPLFSLGVIFFTAWPEEFLFRGVLQNLLAKALKNEWSGLAVASLLFGAAHLPNGVHFPYQVNWRYGILAAIAGWFYGWTWKKTGSIFPGALVHAAVDISWHFFFPTL